MTHGLRAYLIRDAAGDFVFMLRSILESTVDSVRAERERIVAERLRQEVESVRRLQESIIPNDLVSPDGYHLVARYESSQIQVLGGQPVVLAGGDYYDAFMLDDETLVLLLGDASGHGMKACMSIMTMHTLIRTMRNEGYRDTAAFVAEVNRRLCEQDIVHDEGGFITLLFAILRADSHEFQWTSAGHPSPLLHELEEDRIRPLGTVDDGGLPLAIVPDAEYDAHVATIPPNSRLLLYTDGLEEAFPGEKAIHREFGRAGAARVLQACRAQSLEETLQALFDESHAFTDGAGRHDDTSVVLLERD
jgi:serine phosphatase RsbU (regulator of sigma subunit)